MAVAVRIAERRLRKALNVSAETAPEGDLFNKSVEIS